MSYKAQLPMRISNAFFQEILYLTALFGMKKGKSSEEVMQLLQETVETHFATLAVSFVSLFSLMLSNDLGNIHMC